MKLLTFEALMKHLEEKGKNYDFSNHDEPLAVVIDAEFESTEETLYNKLPVVLRACHTELNRNQSFISKEVMEKAFPTFYNIPILGNIIQLDDETYDFRSHDMEIDEETGEVTYIEQPIGVVPESCNPRFEYDEDMDKTYVVVDGLIYEDYGNKAASIIREKGSPKVSVEIGINEFSYNAKEKRLEINDFFFNGVTVLGRRKDGTVIQEGMEGSNITIKENFNKEETMDKFQLILEKYGKTMEDIDFDFEEMTEEEFEAKLNEKPFATLSVDGKEYKFELSYSEKINAIRKLVNATYEDDYSYYSVEVYDDYVIELDYWNGAAYREKYTEEDGVFTLAGERVSVHSIYVTNEEENALNEVRSKFEALTSEKEQLDVKYEETVKELSKYKNRELINSEDYDCIRETEEFEALLEKYEEMETEAVSKELDKIILDYAKSQKFAHKNTIKVPVAQKTEKENKPYGSLFD